MRSAAPDVIGDRARPGRVRLPRARRDRRNVRAPRARRAPASACRATSCTSICLRVDVGLRVIFEAARNADGDRALERHADERDAIEVRQRSVERNHLRGVERRDRDHRHAEHGEFDALRSGNRHHQARAPRGRKRVVQNRKAHVAVERSPETRARLLVDEPAALRRRCADGRRARSPRATSSRGVKGESRRRSASPAARAAMRSAVVKVKRNQDSRLRSRASPA